MFIPFLTQYYAKSEVNVYEKLKTRIQLHFMEKHFFFIIFTYMVLVF